MHLVTESPQETQQFGMQLGQLAGPGDVLLLVGGLGAGKTCLTQGVAWGLGIEGYATSPSFVVVNEYRGRLTLYHIDLYRLDSVEEVADLGLDDYLYGGGVCVVEWADKAWPVLPEENLTIEMSLVSGCSRDIALRPNGGRYADMVSRLRIGQRPERK